MLIDLPEDLEHAVEENALARGVSLATFVREALERKIERPVSAPIDRYEDLRASGYGMLAKYGPAPSEEDIAEARAEMWGTFGDSL